MRCVDAHLTLSRLSCRGGMGMNQREYIASQLRELADEIERDETLNVVVDKQYGLTREYRNGSQRLKHNGTQTITITINGGARDLQLMV